MLDCLVVRKIMECFQKITRHFKIKDNICLIFRIVPQSFLLQSPKNIFDSFVGLNQCFSTIFQSRGTLNRCVVNQIKIAFTSNLVYFCSCIVNYNVRSLCVNIFSYFLDKNRLDGNFDVYSDLMWHPMVSDRKNLGSIFYQNFISSFCQQRSLKHKKDTNNLTEIFTLLGSAHIKVSSKMSEKLTPDKKHLVLKSIYQSNFHDSNSF